MFLSFHIPNSLSINTEMKGAYVVKTWLLIDQMIKVSIQPTMYEVHTIRFQTFFVWAFKIVVDS